MLKASDKEALKKVYGIDVDKLEAAIKAEGEVEFAVPDNLTVITAADLEARDNNNKAAGKKEGEGIGETKGKELAAKAFKRKFNLADTVTNDIDKVVEAVNTTIAKGDDGLREQVTLLQKDKETLTAQVAQEQARAAGMAADAGIIGDFPTNRTSDLTDSERLTLVKGALTFEMVDGKEVVKRGGEVLRDKTTQNPITRKQAISDYFAERKWSAEPGPGGRGGGNNPPGGMSGIKKASEFEEKWRAENPGKNALSDDYINALNNHAKANADFDMDA
jgi:hypothetical protein